MRSIRKDKFSNELAEAMSRELDPQIKKTASLDLSQALDYLNNAYDIFEDAGLTKQADQLISLLSKIADSNHPSKTLDDELGEDLLNLDIDDSSLEVLDDSDLGFEDEI